MTWKKCVCVCVYLYECKCARTHVHAHTCMDPSEPPHIRGSEYSLWELVLFFHHPFGPEDRILVINISGRFIKLPSHFSAPRETLLLEGDGEDTLIYRAQWTQSLRRGDRGHQQKLFDGEESGDKVGNRVKTEGLPARSLRPTAFWPSQDGRELTLLSCWELPNLDHLNQRFFTRGSPPPLGIIWQCLGNFVYHYCDKHTSVINTGIWNRDHKI